MTSDTRSPDDIERDIENERARMSGTINDLQRKFSVEGIVGDLGDMFRNQGGDMTHAISRTVGRNPAAVALVGVGLAWLFLGPNRVEDDNDRSASASRRGSRSRRKAAYPQYSYAADGHAQGDDGRWYDDYVDSAANWSDDGGRTGQKQGGLRPLDSGAPTEGAASAVMGAVRTGVDAVTGAVGAVGHGVTGLKDRLMHGTEGFSDDAQARIRSTRQAAIDAKDAAEAALGRGRTAAADMFAEQPLVLGALAVAIGAAIGGLLPASRIEDDTLGASRDRLFDEALRAYDEEYARATTRAANGGQTADQDSHAGPYGRNGTDSHGQMTDTAAREQSQSQHGAENAPQSGDEAADAVWPQQPGQRAF